MRLPRGFKTETNRVARELRRELGLGNAAPLDPWKVSAHLDIPVVPLSTFRREARDAVAHVAREDGGTFSAATICRGSRRLIVVNDFQHPNRQRSSLAHELAHILLWHKPAQAFGVDGFREWNPQQEAEANWLGAALLVSEEATLDIVRKRHSVAAAAIAYKVSKDLLTFRIQVTGARKRVG